jgi:hypothetical protein
MSTSRAVKNSCLAFLFTAVLGLGACTVALEPAHDPKIVSELETLTHETEKFFAAFREGIPITGFEERVATYNELTSRAATIKIFAEARPAPGGKVPRFLSNLFTSALPDEVRKVDTEDRTLERQANADEAYANATSGFMDDYARNVFLIATRDREGVQSAGTSAQEVAAAQAAYMTEIESYRSQYASWLSGKGGRPSPLAALPPPPAHSVSKNFVERRRVVIEDILTDALFYERDILNRNR